MYKQEVKLKDNEVLAKVNVEDGTTTLLPKRMNNIPEGKSIFTQNDFSKVNNKAIEYLEGVLTNAELGIVTKMIRLADYNTNSLAPLSNKTTVKELSEQFHIGINQVTKTFEKLFNLGVYAQFKISKYGMKEYWILSPYLSFRGKLIHDSIWQNFKGTILEKEFNT